MILVLVTLILPPNRRLAELDFYVGHYDPPFELRAVLDAAHPEPMRVSAKLSIVRVPYRRYPLLGNRVGPSALASIRNLDSLVAGSDLLVTVEAFSSLSAQAGRVAGDKGIPHAVIVWETLSRNAVFRFPPYTGFLERVRRGGVSIVCATKRARGCHTSLGFSEAQCEVIYPGMELGNVNASGEPDNDTSMRLLYLGNFAPWKGIGDLVQASRLLSREGVDHELVFAGRGPLAPYIHRLAERFTQIRYLGYVSEARKLLELSRCDVFLYPSRRRRTLGIDRWEEQFGHAVVEAMMMARAVVVSDSGALPEVVGDDAQVFPEGNVSALCNAIRDLRDPELRKARGAANQRRACQWYSLQHQARTLGSALEKIAAGSRQCD